jgi:signal transduction histidine kinase
MRNIKTNSSDNGTEILLKELKEVNKKLLKAESLRSRFLSDVRNEINNPLASIIGLSCHIMNSGNNDSEKAKSMAALINSEATNLNSQLRNIFAAAEIESGDFIPEYVVVEDVDLLLGEICNSPFNIYNKQVKYFSALSYKKDFITDPTKLELIINNIIAIVKKFSEGSILVTSLLSDEELTVKFEFNIPDENNQRLFFKDFNFYDSEDGVFTENSGLKILVIKHLTELLSGELIFENSNGKIIQSIVIKSPGSDHINGSSGDAAEIFF